MDGLPRRLSRNRLTTIASKAHNPCCNRFPAHPCLLKKGSEQSTFAVSMRAPHCNAWIALSACLAAAITNSVKSLS
jgi:hypothetical protein